LLSNFEAGKNQRNKGLEIKLCDPLEWKIAMCDFGK